MRGAESGETTMARLYGGYRIYQKLGCDILLRGGNSPGRCNELPVAKVMQDVLLSWGIDRDRVIRFLREGGIECKPTVLQFICSRFI